jgi:hypothetical protein
MEETIINFNIYKKSIEIKLKKNLNNIKKLANEFINIYKKFRRESNRKNKKEYKLRAYEYMKMIHTEFSSIENTLRDYQKIAIQNNYKLKKEKIPKFKDYIKMSKKEYNNFKKENDIEERRMIIWLTLFKNKISYMINLIKNDIEKNKEDLEKYELN